MECGQIMLALFIILGLEMSNNNCQGEPTKNSDGTITWEPLPSLGEFNVDPVAYKTDKGRPATLADMSRGWVDAVQPDGFPLDYMKYIIDVVRRDEGLASLDIQAEALTGLETFKGIAACFVIGILFFVLLLWPIAIIFFCCRCCGNCGGKREQISAPNLCTKQIFLSVCLTVSLVILCGGLVSMTNSNNFIGTAKDRSFQTARDIIQDVQTFLKGGAEQARYILEDEYTFVEGLILDDLYDAGILIAGPIEAYLLEEANIQAVFDQFQHLINNVTETTDALRRMADSGAMLVDTGDTLTNKLQNTTDSLTAINLQCGDCIPADILDGLETDVDFAQVPEFDSSISGVETAQADITDIYDQGVEALDQIAESINNASRASLSDVENSIDEVSTQLTNTLNEIDYQLANVSNKLQQFEGEGGQLEQLEMEADFYLSYRDDALLAITFVCFIIFAIFTVGLVIGSIVSKRDLDPRDRSPTANCCGNFLMFGVVLTFLVTPALLLITSLLFFILAPVTLICQPLQNLQLLNETIDQPGFISDEPGYFLGDLIFQNSSIALTVSSILEDCGEDSTLYEAFKLQQLYDVNDLKQYISTVRNQTDTLLDAIDLSDIDLNDLIPDDLNTIRDDFLNDIDRLDFDSFDTQLQESVTTGDLDMLADDLDTIADENPLAAGRLRDIATDLRQFQLDVVQDLNNTMVTLLAESKQLQSLIAQLELAVDETIQLGESVDANLGQGLEEAIQTSLSTFVDNILGYVEQYIDGAITQIVEDFGRCYPVRAIYDSVVNLACHYVLDSLNTVWFSLGWVIIWMIVSLIFAVKLAKYLRIMESVTEPKQRDHSYAGNQRERTGSNRYELSGDQRNGRGSQGNDQENQRFGRGSTGYEAGNQRGSRGSTGYEPGHQRGSKGSFPNDWNDSAFQDSGFQDAGASNMASHEMMDMKNDNAFSQAMAPPPSYDESV